MTRFDPPITCVPVDGGELAVGVWDAAALARPVLAIHGITATHRSWPLVAAALPEARVIAPDLRGRGDSSALPGPFGLAQHARDMVAVLDDFGLDRVDVVAHSMGAFVAVVLARLFPERVASLTLVDGGLPLDSPTGAPSGGTAVLGPAAERLSMTFADAEAYRDFWRRHPAFSEWSPAIEHYVDYDLQGEAPELRSSANPIAIGADAGELYGGADYEAALASIAAPVVFLRAPRGLLDEPTGLYRAERPLQSPTVPGLRVVEVDDVNHYTIVLGERGAAAVADALRGQWATSAEAGQGTTGSGADGSAAATSAPRAERVPS